MRWIPPRAFDDDGQPRAAILLVLLIAWVAVWTFLPWLCDPEIPADNLEQLEWARHPAWGYAKHPPLPSLLLWCVGQAGASTVLITYLLGALQCTFLVVVAWRLARETLPGLPPWASPLLVACITYYSSRMHYYNHNTALMTAYAASLYCLWRAATGRQRHWWILLGFCWGLGLLSKYQMALLIGCNLTFLWSLRARDPMGLVEGVALAVTVALVMLMPHLAWLAEHHFPSLGYASQTLAANLPLGERLRDVLHFELHQAGRLLPALALVATLTWRAGRRAAAAGPSGSYPVTPAARHFWRVHAWGPILGITLLGTAFGVAVETHWGMASLWTVPAWLLTTERGQRWLDAGPNALLGGAVVVQWLMVVGYLAGS